MSKSLTRVRTALAEAGLDIETRQSGTLTRTAQEAADSLGCSVDRIGKSIVFLGRSSGEAILFLTAGGRRVDPVRAADLAEEPLDKANAATIRTPTGFAISGVAPLGHVSPIRIFIDRRLMQSDVIWCAAGTPRHNFAIAPDVLWRLCNATVADFAQS